MPIAMLWLIGKEKTVGSIGQGRFPFLNFIQQRMQWINDFHLDFRQYVLATIQ